MEEDSERVGTDDDVEDDDEEELDGEGGALSLTWSRLSTRWPRTSSLGPRWARRKGSRTRPWNRPKTTVRTNTLYQSVISRNELCFMNILMITPDLKKVTKT